MNKPVNLNDIVEGLEMASEESTSYLDRTTGEVVLVDGSLFSAAEDGEAPDHMADWEREEYETACLIAADEAGRFVPLPDRFDIDEYRMMNEYIRGLKNVSATDELSRAISGRGAFRRFKDTVHRLGLSDDWYRFRDAAYLVAARDWCRGNDIEFVEQ